MRGGGGGGELRGLSQWVELCTSRGMEAQIIFFFGDLTPYLIYAFRSKSSKITDWRENKRNKTNDGRQIRNQFPEKEQ